MSRQCLDETANRLDPSSIDKSFPFRLPKKNGEKCHLLGSFEKFIRARCLYRGFKRQSGLLSRRKDLRNDRSSATMSLHVKYFHAQILFFFFLLTSAKCRKKKTPMTISLQTRHACVYSTVCRVSALTFRSISTLMHRRVDAIARGVR